ncbi:MAG: hypothetical protein DBX58_07395 [Clostridiales bacterium]|nr:MAG: hypothetical protein DBX58_07395 [Clostridiales bacterium]
MQDREKEIFYKNFPFFRRQIIQKKRGEWGALILFSNSIDRFFRRKVPKEKNFKKFYKCTRIRTIFEAVDKFSNLHKIKSSNGGKEKRLR